MQNGDLLLLQQSIVGLPIQGKRINFQEELEGLELLTSISTKVYWAKERYASLY